MNSVCLIGRLTKDPELKTTNSGKPMSVFTLAVTRSYLKEGQPDADFIRCVVWGNTAENLCQYMKQGSMVAVAGRIQTSNFENRDGSRSYIVQVVCDTVQFLEKKADNQKREEPQKPSEPASVPYTPFGIDSDDLPF